MDTIELSELGDAAALEAVGARIARYRLNQNMRQQELAYQAGVSRKTISHIETGASVSTMNLVRVLRALGQYRALDQLLPPISASPLDLVKTQGQVRERARPSAAEPDDEGDWSWPE